MRLNYGAMSDVRITGVEEHHTVDGVSTLISLAPVRPVDIQAGDDVRVVVDAGEQTGTLSVTRHVKRRWPPRTRPVTIQHQLYRKDD